MNQNNHSIKLSLTSCPLLITKIFINNNANVNILWPKKLTLINFKTINSKFKIAKGYKDLEWIQQNYIKLFKQSKTKIYAPHIVPYATIINAEVTIKKTHIPGIITDLKMLPLGYAKNLAQTLSHQYNFELTNSIKLINPKQENHQYENPLIKISSIKPINELETGIKLFFQSSFSPLEQVTKNFQLIDFEQKLKLLKFALENDKTVNGIEYELEFCIEPHLINQMLNYKLINVVGCQEVVPTLGYDIPSDIQGEGQIERCFDISLKLYGKTSINSSLVAQLFCLYGHRQRFLVTINLFQLKSLIEISQNKSQLKFLAKKIINFIKLKHPLTVEILQNSIL